MNLSPSHAGFGCVVVLVQNRTVDASKVCVVIPASLFGRGVLGSSPRPISTGQLESVARLPLPAYQPSRLAGGLNPQGVGYLILKRASRLDAFSGYPFRT